MTDEQAFLTAICVDPFDDTPRLVYADWLDEHRQPERAEFIRTQIELAKMACVLMQHPPPCGPTRAGPKCEQLRRRSQLLLDAAVGKGGWADATGGTIGLPMGSAVIWARGFVESVECRYDPWAEHGDAIVRAQPVTRVRLTTGPLVLWNDTLRRPEGQLLWLARIDADGEYKSVSEHAQWFANYEDPKQRLLTARWPGIVFELPQYGSSPLLAAYDTFRSQHIAFARFTPPARH